MSWGLKNDEEIFRQRSDRQRQEDRRECEFEIPWQECDANKGGWQELEVDFILQNTVISLREGVLLCSFFVSPVSMTALGT